MIRLLRLIQRHPRDLLGRLLFQKRRFSLKIGRIARHSGLLPLLKSFILDGRALKRLQCGLILFPFGKQGLIGALNGNGGLAHRSFFVFLLHTPGGSALGAAVTDGLDAAIIIDRLYPVSYTHLDVYKRQGPIDLKKSQFYIWRNSSVG